MFTLSISQLAAKLFLENAGPRSSELLYVSRIDGFKFRLLKTETTSLLFADRMYGNGRARIMVNSNADPKCQRIFLVLARRVLQLNSLNIRQY